MYKNSTVWKPSNQTPLTTITTIKITKQICQANGIDPTIFSLVINNNTTIDKQLINDTHIPLISTTNSTKINRHINKVVTKRLNHTLLKLGGNNAIIVAPSTDLNLTTQRILFNTVETTNQR